MKEDKKTKCIKVSGENINGFVWELSQDETFDITTCDGFLEEQGDKITLEVIYLSNKELEALPEYEGG